MLFGFAFSLVTHVLADKSLINLGIISLNLVSSSEFPLQETSWSDKLWSVLIFLFLMGYVLSIFRNWHGAISEQDNELAKFKREYPFKDAFLNGIPLKKVTVYTGSEIQEDTDSKDENSFLDEDLDWHSEVKALLKMKSKQFVIKDSDWHSEEGLFISKYNDKNILIICVLNGIDQNSFFSKLNYARKFQDEFYKAFICSKNTCDMEEFELNGAIELSYMCKEGMLESLVNFDEYYDYLLSQFSSVEVSTGDKLTLQDIYVSSKGKVLSTDNEGEVIESVDRYLLDWINAESSNKQISILGDYGQGKSVLSLWIAKELVKRELKRIPIIIELRGKSPRNETLPQIISSWAIRFHIDPLAIQKLLQEGKLLVILEGFDELDMVGDSNRRLEHFRKLWEFARYKRSKVIITGRPNLFLDNDELFDYLHLDKKNYSALKSEAIVLLPFNSEQIKSGLRNAPTEVRNEMLEVLSNSIDNSNFVDLLSRPSTLYQASVIWSELDKSNLNSASVIKEFIRHAYLRQEKKLTSIGKTGIEPPVLTVKERSYFMQGIAVAMVQKNGYSNQINKSDLVTIIARLLYQIPDKQSSDHSLIIPLRERLSGNKDSLESVFTDVRSSGILTRDLTSIDSFKFAHKSFLEYLVADFFMEFHIVKENISTNSIAKALDIKNVFSIDYSSDVVAHIATLLSNNINTYSVSGDKCLDVLDMINTKLKRVDAMLFQGPRYFFKFPLFIFWGLLSVVTFISIGYLLDEDFNSDNYLPVTLTMLMLFIAYFYDREKFIFSFFNGYIKENKSSYLIFKECCNHLKINDKGSPLLSDKMNTFFMKHDSLGEELTPRTIVRNLFFLNKK